MCAQVDYSDISDEENNSSWITISDSDIVSKMDGVRRDTAAAAAAAMTGHDGVGSGDTHTAAPLAPTTAAINNTVAATISAFTATTAQPIYGWPNMATNSSVLHPATIGLVGSVPSTSVAAQGRPQHAPGPPISAAWPPTPPQVPPTTTWPPSTSQWPPSTPWLPTAPTPWLPTAPTAWPPTAPTPWPPTAPTPAPSPTAMQQLRFPSPCWPMTDVWPLYSPWMNMMPPMVSYLRYYCVYI